ncbi:MAG: ribonuclease Y [Phycisphaeraceae bacterium]|nr:ribonuclease Y [Phycisphaerales bacterium]MCB9843862.1 ribonuclease Y [Phycisphaeraceae bacterium]
MIWTANILGVVENATILWGAIGLVLGAIGGVLGVRILGGQTISKAKASAEQSLRLAEAEARTITQQAEVEAQKRTLEERERFEKEIQSEREALREQERRISKREDQHERKSEALILKEEQLAKTAETLQARERRAGEREKEVDDLIERQKIELTRVADLTMDEARSRLLSMIEDDVKEDASHIVRRYTEDAQNEGKEKAREIVLGAVQRYAAEYVSESTVRTIPIPSDDVKGRIIGREGRNIRAIEKATGVDLIVDDTPGVIVVSCFDKVRQAIAGEALTKLIADGRIHPTRVEEVVAQVKAEVEERVVQYGKDAVLECKLRNIHPKISEAMGRLYFRTSYGQNVLRHSLEVAFISQLIADQLGFDGTLARRCGFLHDIGKAMDHEMEGGHPKIGMDFARQHGEKDVVLNAIGGHHGDIPATSFYTPIVMAADAVSGARPGARRESLEKYIQRLEQLQDIALSHEGVDEAHAIQAGREVRVMVDAKKISDDQAWYIAKKIADKVSEEMTFPGEIKVTVLRETRAIEIAR